MGGSNTGSPGNGSGSTPSSAVDDTSGSLNSNGPSTGNDNPQQFQQPRPALNERSMVPLVTF